MTLETAVKQLVSLWMPLTPALSLSLLLASVTGCHDAQDDVMNVVHSEKDDTEADENDGEQTADVARQPAVLDEVQTEMALNDLFKDKIEFTIPELTSGKTNCDDITRRQDLASEVRPWPADLKRFLVAQLDALPVTQQAVEAIFAIYLVDEATLTSDDGTVAAGLACDRGTDYKGIIFLNYNSFVTDREAGGIGEWQVHRSIQERHILLESGDDAAMTLVHEVLHAIDNKLYDNSLDGAIKAGRQGLFDLSWSEQTKPLFERIELMTLTADDAGAILQSDLFRKNRGCGTRRRGEAPRDNGSYGSNGFDLAIRDRLFTGDRLARALRYLAEKTNFIVPYAMTTSAEDFAESLTTYYFGTYLKVWQKRSVYAEDISKGVGDRSPLYVHDTGAIVEKNAAQKTKLCKMAELVFASCKL